MRVGRTGFEVADTGEADFEDMVDGVESDETVEGTDEGGDADGMVSKKSLRPPPTKLRTRTRDLKGDTYGTNFVAVAARQKREWKGV